MRVLHRFWISSNLTNELRDLWAYSPVSFVVERVFFALQYLSIANLCFGTRAESHAQIAATPGDIKRLTSRRGRWIEFYVLVWGLFQLFIWVSFWESPRIGFWVLVAAVYRAAELNQFFANFMFFDHLRITQAHRQAGIPRTVLLTLWNFVEFVSCFGILYAFRPEWILDAKDCPISKASEALYFSSIAQLTIGFGDLHPISWFRMLVPIQGTMGLLLTIVAVARLVALLPRVEPVFADALGTKGPPGATSNAVPPLRTDETSIADAVPCDEASNRSMSSRS